MAALQNFRGALNGFNREDVVRYIEYINNLHAAEVAQLRTELQTQSGELDALRQAGRDADALRALLEQSESRVSQLESQVDSLTEQLEQANRNSAREQTEKELEAYRRAERSERMASERVRSLYEQANGILADATTRVEASSGRIGQLASQVTDLLAQLQTAVEEGQGIVRDASAALYAIRPLESEEE